MPALCLRAPPLRHHGAERQRQRLAFVVAERDRHFFVTLGVAVAVYVGVRGRRGIAVADGVVVAVGDGAESASFSVVPSVSSGTYENARHQPPDPLSLRASSMDTTCCQAPTTTFEGGILNPFLMGGRLGNSIFEMMTINMLARRYDLRAVYARASELCALGIQLWSGSQVMPGPEVRAPPAQQQALVQDLLSAEPPPALPGVLVLDDYFVFPWMAVRIREYFRDAQHAPCLRAANPWRERVDANKDTFVHVRLGDLENYHERDMSAYLAAIGEPEGAVYIASDSPQHHIYGAGNRGSLSSEELRRRRDLRRQHDFNRDNAVRRIVRALGDIGWLLFVDDWCVIALYVGQDCAARHPVGREHNNA